LTKTNETPWHLWVAGFGTLLWSLAGMLHYFLVFFGNPILKSRFQPVHLAQPLPLPDWYFVIWTVVIWSSVSGAILLLLRKKSAFWVFVVTVAALLFNLFQNVSMGENGTLFDVHPIRWVAIAWFIGTGFAAVWYSWAMSKAGVLR
jgi:hypothetical protein